MKIKNLVIASLVGLGFLALLGAVTALIPNPIFTRMVQITTWDYLFLILLPILLSTFIFLKLENKSKDQKNEYTAFGAAFVSIFALGCPICNALLISIFSATALLAYFDPYRPVLGLISSVLLIVAIAFEYKNCSVCKK